MPCLPGSPHERRATTSDPLKGKIQIRSKGGGDSVVARNVCANSHRRNRFRYLGAVACELKSLKPKRRTGGRVGPLFFVLSELKTTERTSPPLNPLVGDQGAPMRAPASAATLAALSRIAHYGPNGLRDGAPSASFAFPMRKLARPQ
jgi:hypothetical protein